MLCLWIDDDKKIEKKIMVLALLFYLANHVYAHFASWARAWRARQPGLPNVVDCVALVARFFAKITASVRVDYYRVFFVDYVEVWALILVSFK
jgi:hypothetical protein